MLSVFGSLVSQSSPPIQRKTAPGSVKIPGAVGCGFLPFAALLGLLPPCQLFSEVAVEFMREVANEV